MHALPWNSLSPIMSRWFNFAHIPTWPIALLLTSKTFFLHFWLAHCKINQTSLAATIHERVGESRQCWGPARRGHGRSCPGVCGYPPNRWMVPLHSRLGPCTQLWVSWVADPPLGIPLRQQLPQGVHPSRSRTILPPAVRSALVGLPLRFVCSMVPRKAPVWWLGWAASWPPPAGAHVVAERWYIMSSSQVIHHFPVTNKMF